MIRSNTPQYDRYLVICEGQIERYAELKEAKEAAIVLAQETESAATIYQYNSSVELRLTPTWEEAKKGEW